MGYYQSAASVSNAWRKPEERWQKIFEIWNTLPSDTLRELVTSMPNHLQAVVDARGGHTKY